jgi:hypothetical protein
MEENMKIQLFLIINNEIEIDKINIDIKESITTMMWENLIGMGFLLNSNPTPNVITFCAFIKRKWFWTLYTNENTNEFTIVITLWLKHVIGAN